MSSRRMKQMASLVKESLAQLLLREVSDPRLQSVVITDVEMTGDLKIAKVYFTTSSTEGASFSEKEILQGFKKAQPFLRRNLSEKIELRSCPELRFEKDNHSEELNRILHLIETEKKKTPSDEP